MQNLQDTEDKVFFECKNILDSLSKINTKEELLLKQDLFYEVSERIAFLKIADKNRDALSSSNQFKKVDNQYLNAEINSLDDHTIDEEDILEEEVRFSNELNDYKSEESVEANEEKPITWEFADEKEEIAELKDEIPEVSVLEDRSIVTESEISAENTEKTEVESTDEDAETIEVMPEQIISENITEEKAPYDENRGKINEIVKETSAEKARAEVFESEQQAKREAEKRFRLANIKGLKSVQSLFDDDPLEETEKVAAQNFSDSAGGSLLKTNIPTDYMEAQKQKPEFRLDLNDKISFSKMLFGGSQSELNDTVNRLNSFTNLEEAKEYLSDLYYERKWDKVDEYAQRLWTLVENKFL